MDSRLLAFRGVSDFQYSNKVTLLFTKGILARSEERRVGKECGS